MRNFLVLALGLALLASTCRATEVLDVESTSIDAIVKTLCGHEHARNGAWKLAGLSTIDQLTKYFESESFPSDLAQCRDEYLEPLQQLNNVVGQHNDNVCGHQKIELISKFHWDYIVANLAKKWRRVSDKKAPEPLRIFFMQFAHMLAERCKETLATRLEQASAGNDVQSEDLFVRKIGLFVDELSLVLVTQNRVKNYDNFLLLWSQVDAKERKMGKVEPETRDEIYGEPVVACIKTKDPRATWAVQRQCRSELRPIYRATVLPVMKLLEMGYGTVEEQTEELFSSNPALGNWYALTQFCEVLLPMVFYQAETLRTGTAVVMSNPREAKGLGRERITEAERTSLSNVVILAPEVLDNVKPPTPVADDKIDKLVVANLKKRNRLFKQFFKNFATNVRGKLMSKLKRFSWSKKTKDNQYELQRGDEIVVASEASMQEVAVYDDADGQVEAGAEPLVKKKPYTLKLFVVDFFTAIGVIVIVLIVIGIIGCLIGGLVVAIMGG